MFANSEQISAATKANFEAQLSLLTSLSSKAFEGVQKMVDLNMEVAKSSLAESTEAAKKLLSAKDPQEFLSLTTAQAQPTAEKAIAYTRTLASIATSTQTEISRTAEEQMTETNRQVLSLIEDVTKNAPPGTENAIAMVKSAVGNANAGYEQLTKTTKQAVEAMENNVNTAVEQFSQAAQKVSKK